MRLGGVKKKWVSKYPLPFFRYPVSTPDRVSMILMLKFLLGCGGLNLECGLEIKVQIAPRPKFCEISTKTHFKESNYFGQGVCLGLNVQHCSCRSTRRYKLTIFLITFIKTGQVVETLRLGSVLKKFG